MVGPKNLTTYFLGCVVSSWVCSSLPSEESVLRFRFRRLLNTSATFMCMEPTI